MRKLPISAVVVSCNEGHLLKQCLTCLQFCEQLIVVDLESSDDTHEVAHRYQAEVWKHKKVPVVEIIHYWIQKEVKYDWMLITDPDEVLRASLQRDILQAFNNLSPNIGGVKVPIRYKFGGNLLKGTPWGGIRSRLLLAHRHKFEFSSNVHGGRKLKPGFKIYNIEFTEGNYIDHYWIESYNDLFLKHLRYLKQEGEARYNFGEKISLLSIIKKPFSFFREAFFYKKGYLDGFTGFALSLFWAWYNTMALWQLWKYQRKYA